MSALTKPHMTVDEFLAWAATVPGRFELIRGEVFAMAPETAKHAKVKYAVQTALASAIRKGRRPCHMLPDGMTIRVDAHTSHEPDALVYCGKEVPPDAVEIPEPLIVVEVLSRSTRSFDLTHKFAGYFRVPSIWHYLIFDTTEQLVIHHARSDGDKIATHIITEGAFRLDPPGLELALSEIYTS